MLPLKLLITQLKNQRDAADRLESEAALNHWWEQTRKPVEAVLAQRDDLAKTHGPLWMQPPENAESLRSSLEQMINTLNRSDEVDYKGNPVIILTALGILFMFLLAGGTYLYYRLFLG